MFDAKGASFSRSAFSFLWIVLYTSGTSITVVIIHNIRTIKTLRPAYDRLYLH